MFQFLKIQAQRLSLGWLQVLMVAVWLIASACAAVAADTDNFVPQVLPQNGKTLALTTADLDGSGDAELILFTTDNLGGRRVRLYASNAVGRYDTIPTVELELPQSCFGFEVTQMDADPQQELLLLGLDAVYLIEQEQGKFATAARVVTTFERLYAMPNPSCIIPYHFASDLNGDGSKELVLPSWNGVRILQKKDNTYSVIRNLSLNYRTEGLANTNLLTNSTSSEVGFHLPTITASDLNTDRSIDLLVETNSGLGVFYQTGNLQFSESPNRVVEIKPSYLEDLYFKSTALADLNNDRLLDYCRAFTQSSGSDYKTVVEIFLGNLQEGYSPRPSKRIVLEEYGVGLSLVDLDGSGVSALVLATAPVSATSMVKALLVKSIPVDFRVYRSEGGIFSDQPLSVKRISCGLNLFKHACPVRYLGALSGDLGNDRACDLVVITDDDELQVFPGSRQLTFADKPSIVRKTVGVASLEVADLNRDSRTDLILVGRDEDGREIVTLLKTK